MKQLYLLAGLAMTSALPAMASPYVVCDNGLRCVTAPCPSTNAYDIGAQKLMEGIWVDISLMPENDRAEVQQSDGMYLGTLVVSGSLEQRSVKTPSGQRVLPHIIARSIERKSSPLERQLCLRR